MLRIYMARHGQDKDNSEGILNGLRDTPLTDLGVRQAEKLAGNIREAGLVFDAIYTSPLARTRVTAEMIARALGAPAPLVMDDLRERDYGIMTGKPVKDIERLCAPDILKGDPIVYFLSPQGGETLPEMMARGRSVIRQLSAAHPGGSVLLVTHGDTGKMLYAAYYDLDWKEVLTMFHFGNCELLLLAPDSKPEESHLFSAEQFNH
jgi:probable phosphoglycerate mutase